MAEANIRLQHPDEARSLFGPRDQHLRQLREATGASVVLRGNAIRILGDEAQVDHCREVLQQWQTILLRHDELRPSDVQQTLNLNVEPAALATETLYGNGCEIDAVDSAPPTYKSENRNGRGGRDKVGTVKPKTKGQQKYVAAMQDHSLVFCDGPAGCGKTYLAVAMALQALRQEEVRKIVLVRPAVEAGEKLGFLPGDMIAKVNPFLRPLLDAMNDMLEFEQVRRYMSNDVIEIAPLAFMRGRTLNDTFMILDEGQNTTVTQMKMFLTRMGINSRIVVTGDATQNDLPPGAASGLNDGIRRLSSIEGVAIVKMTGQDIVRHRLVREIVSAYEADSAVSASH
ncbi:MAG: PhoH family protein [Planctomycetaceae bacterium]